MHKVATHVVMLVNNPCANDSRVRKEAEALAAVGYHLTVVCRRAPGLPITESENGVAYYRIEPIPLNWTGLRSRLCNHFLPIRMRVLLEEFLGMFDTTFGGFAFRTIKARKECQQNVPTKALPTRRLKKQNPSHETIIKQHSSRKISSIHFKILNWRMVKFLKLRGKTVLRWLYWLSESDEFGNAARSYVRKIGPDLIHAHDLATLPAAGRLAKTLGVKLIYDSHELEMHRNASYPRAVMWRRRRLERKYITRADAVITVSESIADHLRDDYAIPRPEVVMNSPAFAGIDIDRDLRGDLGLDESVPLAVYVGSVTINRGIEQTLEALRHDDELQFATVGPRRPATEEDLLTRAAKLGVEDRFHFIDPVPPSQVVPYIRTASVSVLPIQNVCLSYYYCMPNKLLESTFAGVPVAVANLLEMRRFIERYRCGLVMDETDPRDIARMIREIVDNRENFILPPDVRAQISGEYGWPAQAARLAALYRSILQVPAIPVQAAA